MESFVYHIYEFLYTQYRNYSVDDFLVKEDDVIFIVLFGIVSSFRLKFYA